MDPWKLPETLEQLLWMNSMLGLKVIYKNEYGLLNGIVTKVYDRLWTARLKLSTGEVIHGVRPTFIDLKHNLDALHLYTFMPESGSWPEINRKDVCKNCQIDLNIEWEAVYKSSDENEGITSISACREIECAVLLAKKDNPTYDFTEIRRKKCL